MPSFISMKANNSGRINITLNLSRYIKAYEKAYGSDVAVGHEQANAADDFNKLSLEMYQRLDGVSGQIYWINALSLATQHLGKTEQDACKASPAANMMDNSFIEIIKNSMDEAISSYYDNNKKHEPIIQLSLEIDNATKPGQLSIQITDSGHGFPQAFLDKINTEKVRDTYVSTTRGSDKEKHSDRPPLFGGQGRGLRILIADAAGDILKRSGERTKRYTKPEVSSVEFNNAVDIHGHIQGAKITVTTSIEPRVELAEKVQKIKEQQRAERRAHETSSPADSVATTHESVSSRSQTPELYLDFTDDDDFETYLENDDTFSPKR